MLSHYERSLVIGYLSNAAKEMRPRSEEARALVEWVTDKANHLSLDARELKELSDRYEYDANGVSRRHWRACRSVLHSATASIRKVKPDRLTRRLRRLGGIVGLSSQDLSILQLLVRYLTQPVVEDLVDTVAKACGYGYSRTLNVDGPVIPWMLGIYSGAVRKRLSSDAPLVRSGLVSLDDDECVEAVKRLRRLAWSADGGVDVRRLLIGEPRPTELKWPDFDHLGQSRADLENLFQGALTKKARGVNILVYGPPGTGKTEFCKVLAKRLHAKLYGVGEVGDDGDELHSSQRVAELRLAQSLLRGDRNSVLLFDEMDDLLSEPPLPFALFMGTSARGTRGAGSKVFMNRLLEENQTPTLWTTNVAGDINPAILRRMIFALEMRLPPPRIRARIWARQLASRNIEASEADALALAQEFDAPPGVGAGATAAADLGDGGFDLVRRSVRSLSRVLGCERPPGGNVAAFDPNLVEADMDLAALANHLTSRGERRFSICLQGPPGTGKSAYARYLADRLGLEVVQKRTSDLLSMWVGGTERHIAEAFAEARDAEALLIFDEADSLLADRRGAHNSWEVSQVNEMLTWMESHPLPFVCTTNHGANLDSAAFRRFVFKATLGYLKAASCAAAFRSWFDLEAPPSLGALDVLTPGDFEVVRRKADVLGKLSDGDALVEMLRAECAAKPNCAPSIGFGGW